MRGLSSFSPNPPPPALAARLGGVRPPLPTRETAPSSQLPRAASARPPSPTQAGSKAPPPARPPARPPGGGPRLQGGGGGRAGKGRARPRKRARAAVSSSRLPPAGSPRLRNPAGTRTPRSRRRPRRAAAAPPPGTGSGFPPPPLLGHPTPSLPAWAGEQPERSGLPPTPEPPTRASGAATAQLPRSARRKPAQRRDHGGNRRLLPELAAQPRRRPRPGLRGAEPRRGREDGGPEAGAQRSPAPPPPPAAGENCACRLAEARPPPLAAGARLGPRFLPSPPPVLGVLSSALVRPRPVFCPEVAPGPLRAFTAPALRSPPPRPDRGCVLSRFGYPAQRGLQASRSGGSLPGSERRRPPPLGRAQPQLPPAAAAAPPPGAAAALGRRLLLLLLWRRLWLLPAAPRGEKHKAQRPPPAGSPPAARPPAPASARTPPAAAAASAAGAGRRREKGGGGAGGGREKRGSERVLPRGAHTDPRGASASPPASPAPLPPTACPGGLRGGQLGGGAGAGGTRAAEAEGRKERRGGSGGGGGGGCCCRRRGGGGRGRETRSRPDGGGARGRDGRAGAESDLARPAGELACSAVGRAGARRGLRGCPEGPRRPGRLRGARIPAPGLPPKSSKLRSGLPRQLSPAPRSRHPKPVDRSHPHPRSVATSSGRTQVVRGARLPTSRFPCCRTEYTRNLKKKGMKTTANLQNSLSVNLKTKNPLLLAPQKGRGSDRLRQRSLPEPVQSSPACLPGLPGRMEIGAAAARSPLSPRNPRRWGSLTERGNGSAGQGHLGVRRAEEPSRSSAAADAGAASRQTKPEMAKRSDG